MSWLDKLLRPKWPRRDHSERPDMWQSGRILHGTRGWHVGEPKKLGRCAPSPRR